MSKKNDLQNVGQSPFDFDSHRIASVPVYRKVLITDDNGDQHEEFKELSEDELRESVSTCVFSDAVNGTHQVDTSQYDKFQLMDMLERSIAELPDEYFERFKENLTSK